MAVEYFLNFSDRERLEQNTAVHLFEKLAFLDIIIGECLEPLEQHRHTVSTASKEAAQFERLYAEKRQSSG